MPAIIDSPPKRKSAAPRDEPRGNKTGSLEQWVNEHYQAAFRFAFSLSGNYNDACDITQQAFFLAQTRGHQLRDPSKRKQWLFTIIHREFLRLRRENFAPQEPLDHAEPESFHIHVDHAAPVDGQAVVHALQRIEEKFRAPVALFYLKEFSYKQVAELLGVPVGTVMSRLSRGKEMIRRQLALC